MSRTQYTHAVAPSTSLGFAIRKMPHTKLLVDVRDKEAKALVREAKNGKV